MILWIVYQSVLIPPYPPPPGVVESSIYMLAVLQNIDSRAVIGKIFQNKELSGKKSLFDCFSIEISAPWMPRRPKNSNICSFKSLIYAKFPDKSLRLTG
jgi:hypothetical protein